MKIPCPHFNIQIVSRGKGRSVVAAAAYQSGQTLYSQYTGKWEPGEHEGRIVHTEILLPPNAPREYENRQTLWNAVDASEKGQDAQTARRFIIALPKELTIEQNIELIRNYCQTTFVDKGMIADIAVHFNDEDPPNPHAHILLTMRSMDEHGKWQVKSKNMYALDENGNRIIGKNGKPKRIKVNTVDWNDPGNCERWRHEWEVQQNMALDEAGRSERIDMRSYERQGVEMVPETHLGPAASALEKQGMIDGVINNGPKQTVAELEEQAKSGKPVSLMELAQAARREQAQASRQEKKPSVLAKLCPPVNEPKKTARSKRAERELL